MPSTKKHPKRYTMYPAYSSPDTSSDGRSAPDTYGMFSKAETRRGQGMRPFEATLTRSRAVTAPGSIGTFALRAKVTSGP
ncbi:hypothetical protein FVER14953_21367 [Fusarium verticillioides]|nr:hypothetical protein FVER14953_21367 [Fusarium verticillioides]